MIWPFRKHTCSDPELEDHLQELENKIEKAEAKLEEVETKLAETKANAPEMARAVASARRIQYKVDKFTSEISDSFGRLTHG